VKKAITKWWQRVLLFFVPTEVFNSEDGTVWLKRFNGCTYLIKMKYVKEKQND